MPNAYVGRQPIYDREMQVHAYELLFRGGEHNESGNGFIDGEHATTQVIVNTFMEIGLDNIVGQQPAFLNFTRDFLLSDKINFLPKSRVVIEILEDVEVDDQLIDSVKRLYDQGFRIALDDFIYESRWKPLLKLAGIIKIDVLGMSKDEIRRQVTRLKPYNTKLLAEKIESQEEYEFLHDLGFDYFQGYFLSRPKVMRGNQLPTGRAALLDLIGQLNNPTTDVAELETLISRDVGLSFKLLRYINSAFFSLPREVDSIRQAVIFLGRNEIRNWATLLAMSGLSDKPNELLHTALVRARFCEQLALLAEEDDHSGYFTVGLFSTLEAMIETPIVDIIASLPLSSEVIDALTEHKGRMGDALHCTLAYEEWRWAEAQFTGLSTDQVRKAYLDALCWALDANSSLS